HWKSRRACKLKASTMRLEEPLCYCDGGLASTFGSGDEFTRPPLTYDCAPRLRVYNRWDRRSWVIIRFAQRSKLADGIQARLPGTPEEAPREVSESGRRSPSRLRIPRTAFDLRDPQA